MSDNDGILLEDMNHKFDAIMEYLAPMASLPGDVAKLKDDMVVVKSDIKVIKLVLKGHSKDIGELKTDVRELKTDMRAVKDLTTSHDKRIATLERGA